jgi:WG containing repeat
MSESENSPKLEILDTLNKTLEDGRISFFKNPKGQILLRLDSFFDRDYQGQELFDSFGRKNFEALPENSTFQECLDVLEYAPSKVYDWVKKQKDNSKTINSETVNINKTGVSINNERHPFPEVKDLTNLQIFIINGILFGLKCKELGEITIEGITPCSFDKVYGFNGGLAVVGYKSDEFVQFSKQYGLINSKGKILIDRCEGLFNFIDNLILVNNGYSYLVYNKDGQQVKSKYDEIGHLNNKFFYGKIGDSFDVINSSGEIIDNKKCDGDGQCKYDLPDTNSFTTPKAIIKKPYSDKYDSVGEFSQGFAIVKKNGKYSFINEQQKQITDFRYDSAENFNNGLALVRVGKPPNFGIFYGYIDINGREIIPCRYTDANK